MRSAASANFFEMRKGQRYSVDHATIAEHRDLGEISLRIINISQQGLMVRGAPALEQGARIQMRLPIIGKIEGHLTWSHEDRSGFQLERLIRPDDFEKLVFHLRGLLPSA